MVTFFGANLILTSSLKVKVIINSHVAEYNPRYTRQFMGLLDRFIQGIMTLRYDLKQ